MTGRINSFQSLGMVDGPGVRSVVFMQGCNLRCPYCHNPETWQINAGEVVESSALVNKILRFKSYFGNDGGVTFSGGEPLLQADFIKEVFTLLKKEGISTALDTSGTIINSSVNSLLDLTDIVLLDIKFSDDTRYLKYISQPLKKVISFLELCSEKKKRVIIRQVITPGVNDSEKDIYELKKLTENFNCIEKIELLPFKKLCIEKYKKLNINFPFVEYNELNQSKLVDLQNILK